MRSTRTATRRADILQTPHQYHLLCQRELHIPVVPFTGDARIVARLIAVAHVRYYPAGPPPLPTPFTSLFVIAGQTTLTEYTSLIIPHSLIGIAAMRGT